MVDDRWIRDVLISKHGNAIRKKKNVIGWSQTFKPKLREGEPPGEPSFRIYVSKKEDLANLDEKDIIPKTLEGARTDVVVLGSPKAMAVDRQSQVRPVPLGVGIGNWDITEGSLGELYTSDSKVGTFAGTNAHIVTPSPFLEPSAIIEKRILQPGAYSQGKKPENVAGSYVWHKKIEVSGSENWGPINWFGMLIWRIVQLLRQIFGGGASAAAVTVNLIDFGVYAPSVDHVDKTVDDALSDEAFIGHLFASSEYFGIICKVKYIIEQGYHPYHAVAEVHAGDKVKGSSFWGDFETTVFDESADLGAVNYGEYYAPFTDIILVVNDGTIKGGWSGSGFRLIKKA